MWSMMRLLRVASCLLTRRLLSSRARYRTSVRLSSPCPRPVPPLHLDADRGEVLGRGEVAERLVRPDRVVGGLPRPQLGLERAEIGLGVGDLVELLGVG